LAKKKICQILLGIIIVLVMANINAAVDLVLHPDIPYFDEEHQIVGGAYAFFTIIFMGLLFSYANRMEASAEAMERLNQILREQSVKDGLTGLYNHRHFHEMLHHEFSLSKRHGFDLVCMMLDLDHFKDVNDNCGHQFGDFVLRETAAKILAETRSSDTVSRYGGEEFAILLPNTDLAGALSIAERIRLSLENHIHRQNKCAATVTISIGLAAYKTHTPSTSEELLRFADIALYTAKKSGRNQVLTYST